jgi:hypothetical protein
MDPGAKIDGSLGALAPTGEHVVWGSRGGGGGGLQILEPGLVCAAHDKPDKELHLFRRFLLNNYLETVLYVFQLCSGG